VEAEGNLTLKQKLVSLLPMKGRRLLNRGRLMVDMMTAGSKDRAAVFAEIYHRAQWGRAASGFSSGSGSNEAGSGLYVDFVTRFVAEHRIRAIVDLGCGDFRVGRQIVTDEINYHGCDIVADVIAYNTRHHARPNIAFSCRDIVEQELPDGELCLVRQVFQHLSNADILRVVAKLRKFSFVLITDEQVRDDKAASNADIKPFHGTRRLFGQGIKLERPPFSLPVTPVLEYDQSGDNSPLYRTYLRTVLMTR
jgi:SAM-dependent methyltransferase